MFEEVLSKFKIAKRHGNKVQAYCPSHEDKNASLSIYQAEDRLLLFCHAGCRIDDILKSASLTFADLFQSDKKPTAIYQYRNQDGSLAYEKLRYKTAKGKSFSQRRIDGETIVDDLADVRRVPYNYPGVVAAIKAKSPILYVEGEKDCETARMLGYTATTMGGASDWRDEYKEFFKGGSIIQIPDNDEAGMKLANAVSKSLTEVSRSFKVLNLPVGKDLTDWKEAGNNKLEPLLSQCQELVSHKGIPEPSMDVLATGYRFSWNGLGLQIVIDRLRSEDAGEITVYNGSDVPAYISGIKLLSISHKTSLARALKPVRNLDWDLIINQVATKTLADMRKGEQIVMLDAERGSKRPEYLLYPLFIKNAPSIIYADRSSAKSLLMTLIDIVLSLPWHDNPLGLTVPKDAHHVVLFCDWENDSEITGWQKECLLRGLGLGWCDLPYLHLSKPLVDSVDHIRAKVAEVKATIMIVDSLGMAVGKNLNDTEPAFAFYSALRQVPVTPLIIAHTSKDLLSKRKTVYGNAFYENEARCIWELSKQQEFGSNELTITMHHRKAPPFSGYHDPLAFRFTFEGNKTLVESCEPATDKRESDNTISAPDVVLETLDFTETIKPTDIIRLTGLSGDSVYQALKRLKDRHLATGDRNLGYLRIRS